MMRTSVNPEGPWSSEILAFVAMQPLECSTWVSQSSFGLKKP
jgi:hypothetical protein